MAAGTAARAVLVIGAHGVLGGALVRAFADTGWRVVRGARRGDGALGCAVVDLGRPETVAAAIAGVDLVVDPVPHPGLTAERVVLREGGALIDMSMRPAAAARRLRAETTSARGTVVLNAGRTPGVSNLVVADLLAAHPDADAVEIAFSFTAGGASGRAGGEAVHRHLTSARRHGTAVIPFPAPVGPTCCLRFAESEHGWLGDLAARRAVATYARFSPSALHRAVLFANALGLTRALPLAAFVPRSSSRRAELTTEPLTEWVAVRRQGAYLAARTITGAGNYRVTAAATLVLAEALLDPARGDGARPGCFEPQELFSLFELEADLRGPASPSILPLTSRPRPPPPNQRDPHWDRGAHGRSPARPGRTSASVRPTLPYGRDRASPLCRATRLQWTRGGTTWRAIGSRAAAAIVEDQQSQPALLRFVQRGMKEGRMSTGSRPATSTRWWPATLTAGAGSAGAEPQSKREFGRLNSQWSLPPLRGRGLERVRLQADLTILARLACALARTRAAPLEA